MSEQNIAPCARSSCSQPRGVVVLDDTTPGTPAGIAAPAVFDMPIHRMDRLDPRAMGPRIFRQPLCNAHRVTALVRPAIDEIEFVQELLLLAATGCMFQHTLYYECQPR